MKSFIKMLTARQVHVGSDLPPFYFGLAYWSHSTDAAYFTIIPFNYVLRLYRFIEYKWNRLRSKRGWIEKQIELAVNKRTEIISKRIQNEKKHIEELEEVILQLRKKLDGGF